MENGEGYGEVSWCGPSTPTWPNSQMFGHIPDPVNSPLLIQVSRRLRTSTAYTTRLCSHANPICLLFLEISASSTNSWLQRPQWPHTLTLWQGDAYLMVSVEHNGYNFSSVHAKPALSTRTASLSLPVALPHFVLALLVYWRLNLGD